MIQVGRDDFGLNIATRFAEEVFARRGVGGKVLHAGFGHRI
jgi:hypothetical protein